METLTIERENRRVAYEEMQDRIDRTPGTFAIFISPFKTAYELASVISDVLGVTAEVFSAHIGGQGWTTFVTYREDVTQEPVLKPLYQDARGRWYIALTHPCFKYGMPDVKATEDLANHRIFGCESPSGNFRKEEVADMRHPTW